MKLTKLRNTSYHKQLFRKRQTDWDSHKMMWELVGEWTYILNPGPVGYLNTFWLGAAAMPAAPVISSSIWPRCIWPEQAGRMARQSAQSSLQDGSQGWRSFLQVGKWQKEVYRPNPDSTEVIKNQRCQAKLNFSWMMEKKARLAWKLE